MSQKKLSHTEQIRGKQIYRVKWPMALKISGLMLFTFLFLHAPQVAADIIIIGNKATVPDQISKDDIELIFTGKKKNWPGGTAVRIVLYTKREPFGAFVRKYTGRPRHLFKSHWRRLVFTGSGKAPKGFKTEGEVLKYIEETKGAIGFLSSEPRLENVNIINIIGEGAK